MRDEIQSRPSGRLFSILLSFPDLTFCLAWREREIAQKAFNFMNNKVERGGGRFVMKLRTALLAAAMPTATIADDQAERFQNHMAIQFECVAGDAVNGFYARYRYPEGYLKDETGELTSQGRAVSGYAHNVTANTADVDKDLLEENQDAYTRSADRAAQRTEEEYSASGPSYSSRAFSNDAQKHLANEAGKGLDALKKLSPLCNSMDLMS